MKLRSSPAAPLVGLSVPCPPPCPPPSAPPCPPLTKSLAKAALALALALGAGLLCPATHAAMPASASEWYTPENVDWEKKTVAGLMYYKDENGKDSACTIEINENDSYSNWDFGELGLDDKVYNLAAFNGLKALITAQNNRERIQTIGKNLNEALNINGVDLQYTDDSGNTRTYTLNFRQGTLGNATSQGSNPTIINPAGADWLSIDQDANNRYTVNGWTDREAVPGTIFTQAYGDYEALVRFSQNAEPTYIKLGGADFLSLETDDENHLALKGWSDNMGGTLATIGEALTQNAYTPKELTDYQVLVRKGGAAGDLTYVDVGSISTGNANPDLATIVTNAAFGAAVDGALSLRGWTQALDNALPYKYSEGATLNWLSPPTKEGKAYYLGTDSAAKFGYHELIASSNATKVAGDNAAVTVSDIATDSTGTQVISLKGWNNVYSSVANPLYLANVGGSLAYLPIALPEDTCTQKWDTVANWVGSTAKNEAKTLTLPQESLAEYLKKEHGMVYSTSENADLHFDSSSSGIEASFNAPNNWADDSTIEVNESGKYAIKVGDSCESTLSSLLSDPSSGTAHSFLALEASGDLHYVPLGAGITGGVQPDGVSIVSNETGLAIAGYANASTDTVLTRSTEGLEWKNLTTPDPITVDGVSIVSNETGLAIAGYANASTDTVLTRSSSGVEWKSVTAEGDGTTITTTSSTTDPKLTIVGFENANTNTVLMKSASGTLEWGAASGGGTIMGNTSDSVAVPISGAVFKSDEYSNVQIKTKIIDGVPTITIGVYYK